MVQGPPLARYVKMGTLIRQKEENQGTTAHKKLGPFWFFLRGKSFIVGCQAAKAATAIVCLYPARHCHSSSWDLCRKRNLTCKKHPCVVLSFNISPHHHCLRVSRTCMLVALHLPHMEQQSTDVNISAYVQKHVLIQLCPLFVIGSKRNERGIKLSHLHIPFENTIHLSKQSRVSNNFPILQSLVNPNLHKTEVPNPFWGDSSVGKQQKGAFRGENPLKHKHSWYPQSDPPWVICSWQREQMVPIVPAFRSWAPKKQNKEKGSFAMRQRMKGMRQVSPPWHCSVQGPQHVLTESRQNFGGGENPVRTNIMTKFAFPLPRYFYRKFPHRIWALNPIF